MRLFSLDGKLAALLGATLIIACASTALFAHWLSSAWYAAAAPIGLLALPVLMLARATMQPLQSLLRALSGGVASYRDGDFSTSLAQTRRDEFGELIGAHNELGNVLREQRQAKPRPFISRRKVFACTAATIACI